MLLLRYAPVHTVEYGSIVDLRRKHPELMVGGATLAVALPSALGELRYYYAKLFNRRDAAPPPNGVVTLWLSP